MVSVLTRVGRGVYETLCEEFVMDDTAVILNRDTVHSDNFVDRQFSPVRIERLLLTRLFDLATGGHINGERAMSSIALLSGSQTGNGTGGRREAA